MGPEHRGPQILSNRGHFLRLESELAPEGPSWAPDVGPTGAGWVNGIRKWGPGEGGPWESREQRKRGEGGYEKKKNES